MVSRYSWFVAFLLLTSLVITNRAISNDLTISQQLTKEQTKLLAVRIMENTPEFIHYAKKFTWVLLSDKIKLVPTDLQDEVIKALQKKYIVYFRREDVPAKLIEKNEDGSWYGIIDGFLFSFRLEFEDAGVVKVNYSDWENGLAASSHWKRYRWTGTNWIMIAKSALLVS